MTYAERASEALTQWRATAPEWIAVDTETEGVAYYDRAFCAVLGWPRKPTVKWAQGEGPGPKNVGVILPDGTRETWAYAKWKGVSEWEAANPIVTHYIELVEEDHSEALREILVGTPRLVFHNAKFDLQKLILAGALRRHEITPERIEDTQTLAALQWTERRKKLKYLGEVLLGIPDDEERALKDAMKENKLKVDDGYHLLPREVLIPYALQDANLTALLFQMLRPYVAQYPELENLYGRERRVTLALLDMEARGYRIDLPYVDEQIRHFSREFVRLESEVSRIVGKPVGKNVKKGEFNPGSPKQLGEFFEAHGISTPYVTKKGQPSYNDDFLDECEHPLANAIREYRKAGKMKNTYFLAMRDEQRDGILHPNFNQNRTKTGRFSSSSAGEE